MKKVILLSVLILLLSSGFAFAAVPCKINYQGRLIKDNVPVDGTKTMVFSIYTVATGGIPIWTSGNVNITVYNGLFRYVLDLSTINWAAGQTLYLEVKVGADILTPREELSAYPYAINSHLLEGATKEYFLNTSADTQTKQGNLNIMGNLGIGTTSPGVKLDVAGKVNAGGMVLGDNSGKRIQTSSDMGLRAATSGTDHLIITTSGNVGIGTTSPDATLEVKGTVKILGSWESKSNNTVYKAASDGFVCASGPPNTTLTGFTDGSSPPTTARLISRAGGYDHPGAITMPVKKGDYWKVTGATSVYWIPFGG